MDYKLFERTHTLSKKVRLFGMALLIASASYALYHLLFESWIRLQSVGTGAGEMSVIVYMMTFTTLFFIEGYVLQWVNGVIALIGTVCIGVSAIIYPEPAAYSSSRTNFISNHLFEVFYFATCMPNYYVLWREIVGPPLFWDVIIFLPFMALWAFLTVLIAPIRFVQQFKRGANKYILYAYIILGFMPFALLLLVLFFQS